MKTKTLIVNLEDQAGVLESAYLIAERVRKYPQQEIYMLTFKESKHLAHMISGVQRVFTIDQDRIKSLLQNDLYSNGFAVNNFFKNLSLVFHTEWNIVVNYSTTTLSKYITSSLTADRIIGSYTNEVKENNYSSLWASIDDIALKNKKLSPLKSIHCKLKANNISYGTNEPRVKINENNNKVAFSNLNSIRNAEHTDGEAKIIGINISSTVDSIFSLNKLTELLEQLFSTPNMIPLLIIEANNEQQKNIVNLLNRDFENSLLSVESDDLALPSLLMNIDILVTSDRKFLNLANLVDTPTISLFTSIESLFRAHSQNTDDISIVLSGDFSIYNIYLCIDSILSNIDLSSQLRVDDSNFFTIKKDNYGSFLHLVQGEGYKQDILTSLVQRYYITSQNKNSDNQVILEELFSTFSSELSTWALEQKKSLIISTKLLLRSLRNLIRSKQDSSFGSIFMDDLNKLLATKDKNLITSIPIEFFEFNLEKINSKSAEENLIIMEHLIYDLKTSLRKIMTTLALIESKNRSQSLNKKETRKNGRA